MGIEKRARSHPENPGGDRMAPEAETSNFPQMSRKSRTFAEVYGGTPNKENRRLTKSFRKKAGSGRELVRPRNARVVGPGVSAMLRILTILAAAVALVPTCFAATLTVDRVDDTASATNCNPSVAIDCSLRGAIIAANLTPGADVILMPSGTFTLTIQGTDNTAAAGDLDITDHLNIIGAGRNRTVIDAGGSTGLDDRVFHIDPSAAGLVVEIRDLTIRGGDTANGGGGINVNCALNLQRVTLSGNHANGGGGIYAQYGSDVTVEDCLLDGNNVDNLGGAIFCDTIMTITRTTIGNNTAVNGAGLYVQGASDALVQDSLITGNTASGSGGGVYVESSFGSGIDIERSTITDNQALFGAALYTENGVVSLRNSTVSGNVSTAGMFGTVIQSAELNQVLEFTNCTCADNDNGGSGTDFLASGAGIHFTNTIVEGSCAGDFSTGGGNIECPSDNCGMTDATDQTGVSTSMLGLAPLGGTPPVHRLQAASIAIDAGINRSCPATDQRGMDRLVDGDSNGWATCDVGAIELQTLFRNGFEDGTTNAWSLTVQ